VVTAVAPRALGEGVIQLGGGRTRIDDVIDPGVGFEVFARPGATVEAGDCLGVVHARSPDAAQTGAAILRASIHVSEGSGPVIVRPLVSHRLGPGD
jgi:thymidine phosphorylase